MRKFLIAGVALALAALAATAAGAVNLIHNGDFATGDFTDWTLSTTVDGTLGDGINTPTVSSFDVTGGGAQNAAHLNVGQVSFDPGNFRGGTLSQVFTSAAGEVNYSIDVAVFNPYSLSNASAGEFTVQIDGDSLAINNPGAINGGQTLRWTMSGNDILAAGSHTLSIIVERPFIVVDHTPQQYLTNISVDGASVGVPEPASWTLMIAGFGLAGAGLRRRARLVA
jgi:hypothetical protein